jgi:hypothetical protein
MEGKTAASRWNRLLGFQGRDLWKLFSNAGVLTHIWTFILFLRDFSWLNERTNVWDAVAVGAYGLVTAFIESIFVFLILVLIGFILPRGWQGQKRLAILSATGWIVGLFAVAGQLYFLLGNPFPEYLINILAASGHPLRFLYLAVIFATLLVIIPVYTAILKSDGVLGWFTGVADRVATLMAFYLFFDFFSLVIVVIRNLR